MELAIRVLLFIVDQYHQAMTSSKKLTKLLDEIRQIASMRLKKQVDTIGFSLAGLKLMKKELNYLKEEQVTLNTFQ